MNNSIRYTWVKSNKLDNLSPITQVYGICFNEKGEILICRESPNAKWQLPGGHPEKGETIQRTLERELIEEVDIRIKNIRILGYQKVEYPNNPDKTEGDQFYQVRCTCEVEQLLPQSVDPATGHTWERMFVPAEKITDYIKWGNVGDAMFKAAGVKISR